MNQTLNDALHEYFDKKSFKIVEDFGFEKNISKHLAL